MRLAVTKKKVAFDLMNESNKCFDDLTAVGRRGSVMAVVKVVMWDEEDAVIECC